MISNQQHSNLNHISRQLTVSYVTVLFLKWCVKFGDLIVKFLKLAEEKTLRNTRLKLDYEETLRNSLQNSVLLLLTCNLSHCRALLHFLSKS